MEQLKSFLKLLLLFLWIVLCCLPAWVAKMLGKMAWRDGTVRLCYLGVLRIIGVRLKINGQLAEARPLLLVTNHVSYLDVALLGSVAAVRFAPKREVAGWPLIGAVCRLCDAVFIDRRPEKISEMKQVMKAALEKSVVCLFPESTTGNGLHLLPFKSGFFSLGEDRIGGHELLVQPAAITYTRIRRLPIGSTEWPRIAWYGDMALLPHLLGMLRLGGIEVELAFLPPLRLSECGDRKQLAA
ncbi:MAG: 1-acyl-sn-glycerol-3-phosphate acyltransferase, partial [Pseudomonadota bacterium]|nr:1-acyl-sn-glycerol-3-phosphate acyltransferase [Pseudomonadota bacterium]